ncbi:helix-turn-helix domain-containing protein [Halapricum desulfuricans]|nr:helix-turn-helix domain-containing protein [Halapricum desulfuricans]
MAINRFGCTEDPIDPDMEDRDLRVVLEIDRGGPCRLDSVDGDVVNIDVRLSDETCSVDATVREPEEESVVTQFFENNLCDHCPGKVFADHGCLPRYRELSENSFVVETYVSDTEAVADLVADIREICARVSLKSIVSTDTSAFEENCSVDISALTTKQREAVYHAQKLGYYDPDSDVSLDTLADRIGISTSALSQRLRRAEANVLRQLSVECSCWDDVDG